MGTSKSFGEFAHKLTNLQDNLEDVPKRGVSASALHIKRQVMQRLGSSGAPVLLRGVGKKGVKVGVRYDVKTFTANTTALITATGPFQLVERDTKAHAMPRQRKRGRKRALKIPGVGFRASARHPGTKGKHPFAKGVQDAMPKVRKEFNEAVSDSITKVF